MVLASSNLTNCHNDEDVSRIYGRMFSVAREQPN